VEFKLRGFPCLKGEKGYLLVLISGQMSGRICGRIFDKGPDERNARFVLLAIGEYANKSGSCFPYIQSIAMRTLFTREYVGRTIEQLIRDGWIYKTPHPSNHRSFGYQVNMAKLGLCEPNSSEHNSYEDSSYEDEAYSHVNFNGVSCEQSSEPPHPLIGVTVNNRQEEPLISPTPYLNDKGESKQDVAEQELKIYETYPRRVGKERALKAIRKAVVRLEKGDESHEKMDAYSARRFLWKKVKEYACSPAGAKSQNKNEDFRPHPATWFNDGRYFDERIEWQKPNGGKNASVPNGRGQNSVGVLEEFISDTERSRTADENGDLSAGEYRQGDPETIHGISGTPRLASFSSGNAKSFDF